ncbi:MAG: hypothetical protein AC479_05205 [miscellaneous Crenarchaeota group-6 archaeon AD8-1]|nr:MAG: hypothetical protein AC479_05205 [miscellaneous Crenarchaeota group-6 archaeon AD8-1]
MAAQNSKILKLSNILAFIATVIINSLAGSTTLIGGKNTAEISDAYPTLITPADYVFSIWGIIYILLGIFVIYQALPRNNDKDFTKRVGWYFVLSSVLNIIWLFLWQFEYLSLSVVVMFLLLLSLILIYTALGIGKTKVDLPEKLFVHVPFSVYLGWITIASIANVASALVKLEWDAFGINPEIWAILIIIIALAITMLVLITRKDIAYSLVIIWALIGIAYGQNSTQNIAILAQAFSLIILIAMVVLVLIKRFKK